MLIKNPVLPGMEEYIIRQPIYDTNKKDSARDLYNLRLLSGLKSADHYGLPVLQGYMPPLGSTPLPFNEARSIWKKTHSLRGYFIHFFINDPLFDCIRKNPDRYISMLKSADFVIAPDFSTYRNYPFPVLLKNGYDNMLLACYYQRKEINIVPNIFWSSPMFYDVLFSGQPTGSSICVNSKSLSLHDTKGVRLWLHGYREAIKRLFPKTVIRIGKIVPGEIDIFASPVRYEVENKHIKYIRYGR